MFISKLYFTTLIQANALSSIMKKLVHKYMTDIPTLNLSDSGDGMVNLNNNQSTNFIPNGPPIQPQNIMPEKNVSENKQTMDSTPISDIMGQVEAPLEPPMMAQDPRMTQAQAQAPMMLVQQQPTQQQTEKKGSDNKNPFNLTDDQFQALVVAVCTAIAISKPVQEKLANFVPQFLNDHGNRSAVGLAATGVVAAVAFYAASKYVN